MALGDPFTAERGGSQPAPCANVAAGTEARAGAKQDGRDCIAAFDLATSTTKATDHFHVQGVSLPGPVSPSQAIPSAFLSETRDVAVMAGVRSAPA